MADEGSGASRSGRSPRANKPIRPDRTCADPGCNTKLSIYSKWDYCWQHEPVSTYVAGGKRRSPKEMEAA